jgi:hypothetical protein
MERNTNWLFEEVRRVSICIVKCPVEISNQFTALDLFVTFWGNAKK